MKNDRRDDQRLPTNLIAKWDGLSGAAESRVEDISLGGCFVNTKGQVQVGEPVSLKMQLEAGDWLCLRGEVVSYQPGIGFGVVFTSLSEDDKKTLKRLLT